MAYDGILADPSKATMIDYKTVPTLSLSDTQATTYEEMVKFYTENKAAPIVWNKGFAGCSCPMCKEARGEMRAPNRAPGTPLEILKAARALIAKAWCQGAMNMGRRVCSVGAIVAAIQGLERPESMSRNVELELERTVCYLPTFHSPSELIRFNDRPSTTQKDVLHLFDRGIAALEGREPSMEPGVPFREPKRLSFNFMDLFA